MNLNFLLTVKHVQKGMPYILSFVRNRENFVCICVVIYQIYHFMVNSKFSFVWVLINSRFKLDRILANSGFKLHIFLVNFLFSLEKVLINLGFTLDKFLINLGCNQCWTGFSSWSLQYSWQL